MTTKDIERLREVVEKATPGPWKAEGWDDAHFMGVYGVRAGDRALLTVCNCHAAPDSTEADHDFIATFDPSLVSALLDVWEGVVEMRRRRSESTDRIIETEGLDKMAWRRYQEAESQLDEALTRLQHLLREKA